MNKYKIEYSYIIGCGTFALIFMIAYTILCLKLYFGPFERQVVDYIIEHQEEFEEEFYDMGYKLRIAYTRGDLIGTYDEEYSYKKIGHEGRGVLILYNDNEEYHFDAGFDYYRTEINSTFVRIQKNSSNKVLHLEKRYDNYPIKVLIGNEETKKSGFGSVYNDYNVNFDEFEERKYATRIDVTIKRYISAEELREMYEKGIDLQDKLVEMYKQHKGMSK